MDKEERERWVARGCRDPREAYNGHASTSAARGVPFNLTFEQWWELWEPHYDRRGVASADMCMGRVGDSGGYDLGNVRIITSRANHLERASIRRASVLDAGRLPASERSPGMDTEWLEGRYDVFAPYVEPDDDDFS